MNERNDLPRDEIRELLAEAGRPAPLPAEDLAAIRRAARRRWTEASSAPILEGRRSWRPVLALAASVLLAIGAVWLWRAGRPPAAEVVATVELVRGEAPTELEAGRRLAAGTTLATPLPGGEEPIRVALRLGGGQSVRIDAGSRVRLASERRLRLERGALYVDSGPNTTGSLEIVTEQGTIRELGTQYEVRLVGEQRGGVRVRVREGHVSLTRGEDSLSAGGGEELTVRANGAVERERIEIAGPAWSWVTAVAPGYRQDVDGGSFAAYLAWVSRETGWRIELEDSAADLGTDFQVIGTFDGLTPEQTLEAVLPGSGLSHRIEGDALVIAR